MLNSAEVTHQWSAIREKLKDHWEQLTDDDLRLVAGNIEGVVANISRRTGVGRQAIEDFVREVADEMAVQGRSIAGAVIESATEAVRESISAARETADEVGHQVREGYASTERFVRERPAQTVAGVFATGVLVGGLLGLFLRSEI